MKYFILLNSNSILCDGAVLSENGLAKLKSLTNEPIEVEETTEYDGNSYEFVSTCSLTEDDRCGERNVFHDHNGNEYHN